LVGIYIRISLGPSEWLLIVLQNRWFESFAHGLPFQLVNLVPEESVVLWHWRHLKLLNSSIIQICNTLLSGLSLSTQKGSDKSFLAEGIYQGMADLAGGGEYCLKVILLW